MRIVSNWLGRIFYALGQAVLPAGRLGRLLARFFLTESLALAPHEGRTRGYLDYLQGIRAMERGDPEEALRLLRRAAKTLPYDAAVRLDAGVAMTICGEWEAAQTTLAGLLREYPRRMSGERQFWFALAWAQLRLGRYSQALETARQAAEATVGTPQLHLVAILAQLGGTGTVDGERLRRLMQTHPPLLANVLEFAEHLAGAGRFAPADQLLQLVPSAVLPHSLRLLTGSALNGEQLAAARWALGRWAETAPESAERLVLESELHLHEGKLEKAVAAARQAVQLDPSASPEEQLGETLLLAGREAEAFPHFVEALAHGSLSALAGAVVAFRMLDEGRIDEARRLFRVERRGGALGCALAHGAVGRVKLAEGDLPEALALAERAWEEASELPSWTHLPSVRAMITASLARLLDDWLAASKETASEADVAHAKRLRRGIEEKWQ